MRSGVKSKSEGCCKVLWLKDIKRNALQNNIEIYRLTRISFGIISSTFLHGGTVHHHLEQTGGSTANQINDNIYVDNLVTGANNEKEAYELYIKGRKIFKDASMNV